MGKNTFIIIGLGFVADRHIEAIESAGGEIVAGCDIDKEKAYKLPKTSSFFSDYTELKRNIDSEYVVICTPNYLHYPMIETFPERITLCEKPLMIDYDNFPWRKARNVYAVHQLRFLPELIALKREWELTRSGSHKVNLTLEIRRDQWYFDSWKGNENQSGGLLYNIGVHYVDLLVWIFGDCERFKIDGDNLHWVKINFDFPNVSAELYITLDAPMDRQKRSLQFDDRIINLSKIDKLHQIVYQNLLKGFGHTPISLQRSYYLIDVITKKFREEKICTKLKGNIQS